MYDFLFTYLSETEPLVSEGALHSGTQGLVFRQGETIGEAVGCPVNYRLAKIFGYPGPVEITTTSFQCGHRRAPGLWPGGVRARRALRLQLEQGERENARGALEYST